MSTSHPRGRNVRAVAGSIGVLVLALAGSSPASAVEGPRTASALAGAAAPVQAAASGRAAASARTATRLAISAAPVRGRPGDQLLVVAKLTRASSGAAVPGRVVRVWVQRLGSDRWTAAAGVRTDRRGRMAYRAPLRGDTRVTVRFAGDTRFRPAAGLTLTLDARPFTARLDPGVATAVTRARTAARRAGVSLRINSGFRTWSQQVQMYRAAVRRYGSAAAARRWVLPPQESHHVTGEAVDLGPPGGAGWLAVRSARFGLCRPYANEPWHFEYRPSWIDRNGGRCPAPVARPGDPGPYDPAPRVRAYPGSTR